MADALLQQMVDDALRGAVTPADEADRNTGYNTVVFELEANMGSNREGMFALSLKELNMPSWRGAPEGTQRAPRPNHGFRLKTQTFKHF